MNVAPSTGVPRAARRTSCLGTFLLVVVLWSLSVVALATYLITRSAIVRQVRVAWWAVFLTALGALAIEVAVFEATGDGLPDLLHRSLAAVATPTGVPAVPPQSHAPGQDAPWLRIAVAAGHRRASRGADGPQPGAWNTSRSRRRMTGVGVVSAAAARSRAASPSKNSASGSSRYRLSARTRARACASLRLADD